MLTFLDVNVTLYLKLSNLGVSRIGGWSGLFGCGLGVPGGRVWYLVQGFLALLLGGLRSVSGGVGPIFGFACTPTRMF